MEEKNEGFEVVNKRRVNAEAEAPKQEAAPEAPTAEVPQGEMPGQEQAEAFEGLGEGGLPDVDVYGLLTSFVSMLYGFAWQKMGFMANPATGKVDEDLPQAKVAIDTVQFLVGQLEPKLSADDVRELRRTVMDLQMNFMRKNSGA